MTGWLRMRIVAGATAAKILESGPLESIFGHPGTGPSYGHHEYAAGK
jgi:hypothetical protein